MPDHPSLLRRLASHEDLNFLLTNRIPRRWATVLMGRLSRCTSPVVRDASLWVWQRFTDLDLSDARKDRFESLHDCFTRELRLGARPIDPDPDVITSPCDAVIGAHGRLVGTEAFQIKGSGYRLEELLPDSRLAARHTDGWFVTLRLRSSFYHRFHAPLDAIIRDVWFVPGDVWNVNPIALARVDRLFCKNERAAIAMEPRTPGVVLTLVPVAAILVASLQLHFIDSPLELAYRGPNHFRCDTSVAKGDELGLFQHGSTILVFASGEVELADGVREGRMIRVGQPLLRRTTSRGHE